MGFFPLAIATAGCQCADSGSFTALTQPWCSQFSSLLHALHMGFIPAFGLDSSLRHFLLSTFLCFFTIPSRQQGQLARTRESSTVHMAQMMPQGKHHPPSSAWWPHSLTHCFLSTASITPPEHPTMLRQPRPEAGHCW